MEISTDSLSISQPGSYPTMLALSGQLDGVAQHLDSQRFLLPVLSDTTDTEDTATPTTMIYPISAQTNVLGGETGEAPEEPPLLVSSDALAGELDEGGRLQSLSTPTSSLHPPCSKPRALLLIRSFLMWWIA